MKKTHRTSWNPAALVCLLITFACGVTHSAEKPHILLILADDMGYGDLKAYNPDSKIPTPHLDALAEAGMTFTDAHSGGSTCIPSRFSLMTGQFAVRAPHVRDRLGPVIPDGMPSAAGMLRDQGYKTAMVGKWHLGFERKGGPLEDGKGSKFDYSEPLVGGPIDRGFDSYFGMHASLDIPPYFYIRDRAPVMKPTETVGDSTSEGGPEGWNHIQGAFWRAGDVSPDFKHVEVTPRFADETCKVIEAHAADTPLFLYLALPSPHTPWLPTEEFKGESGAGMYGDFTLMVDSVVGQVLASLDEADMAENTLVIFSSDNGPVWYEKDVERFDHRSVGPLRGCKASVWEGGHRVPFIVRWPGRVEAGSRNDHTIAFADVYATLAEANGLTDFLEGEAVDSVSFLPSLLGKGQETRPAILHGDKVIRDGDWKLIATSGGRGFNAPKGVKYGTELLNLRDDLAEQNNLAESMPEKVKTLKQKLADVLGSNAKNN